VKAFDVVVEAIDENAFGLTRATFKQMLNCAVGKPGSNWKKSPRLTFT